MEHTDARPRNRRPLQNLPPTTPGGFVAAVPSRAFRDGTGIFMVKLSHSQEKESLEADLAYGVKFTAGITPALPLLGMELDAKPELFNFRFPESAVEYGP